MASIGGRPQPQFPRRESYFPAPRNLPTSQLLQTDSAKQVGQGFNKPGYRNLSEALNTIQEITNRPDLRFVSGKVDGSLHHVNIEFCTDDASYMMRLAQAPEYVQESMEHPFASMRFETTGSSPNPDSPPRVSLVVKQTTDLSTGFGTGKPLQHIHLIQGFVEYSNIEHKFPADNASPVVAIALKTLGNLYQKLVDSDRARQLGLPASM